MVQLVRHVPGPSGFTGQLLPGRHLSIQLILIGITGTEHLDHGVNYFFQIKAQLSSCSNPDIEEPEQLAPLLYMQTTSYETRLQAVVW